MVIILLFGMISLVFFESCEQELIHAHTLRLSISLDLLTLSFRDVDTDMIVMPYTHYCCSPSFFSVSANIVSLSSVSHSEKATVSKA